MTVLLSIDTAAARSAGSTWAGWGDQLASVRGELADTTDRLALDSLLASCDTPVAGACEQLWVAAAFVTLVADRAESADLPRATTLTELLRIAGEMVAPLAPRRPVYSPLEGELGGTYGSEIRSPLLFDPADPLDRGRQFVLRALTDTASKTQVHADEFEIVRLADGRVAVVLPGVTDLSSPDLGLSHTHASIRDLDQAAYRSAASTRVADNRYAQMVWEALRVNGVAAGTELVLVGHSFGADTALDLAADPFFNGPTGYHVTHVVAAGYHSDPQPGSVPDQTEVLVLQNRYDAAVIGEAIGDAGGLDAIDARLDLIDRLADFDLWGAFGAAGRGGVADMELTANAIDHLFDRSDDLLDAGIGVATFDPIRVGQAATNVVTLEPGVSTPRPGQVVAVFEGGTTGAGHHQDNYVEYLAIADDPELVAFLVSLGGAGSTLGGTQALDVSADGPS